MSSFTTPLIMEMLPKRKFKLKESFIFYVGAIENNEVIKVPEGFITDLASIPRVFWSLLPPNGYYGKAAVLHDYMYVNKIKNKKYADDVFLEAMKVLGIGTIKRNILYYGVRFFGKGAY